MKHIRASIAILFLFAAGCVTAYAQARKACSGEDGCCAKSKGKKTATSPSAKPLACKLTSKEMQDRKATVIAELKTLVIERKELRNGYSYKFKGDDANIDRLASFVKTERACCDFFDFSVLVKGHFVFLELTGPKGAKDFVNTEIGM